MRFYHIKREDFTRNSGVYKATLFVFGIPLLSRTQKTLPHFAESSISFSQNLARHERERERERVKPAIYFLFIKSLALGFLPKRHKGDFISRII